MATETLSVEVQGVDKVSGVLKSIESGVIRFVGAVSSALTVLSVIGFPVASAAAFQKQLLEVKKTTDFTNESMSTLKSGLTDLSKTTNVAASELARIAALGGQMGIGAQGPATLLAFTEELSRAVSALDISADAAAPALGKLVNIFNLPLGQFQNAVAVINELSAASNATAEEILDVQRRIGDLGGSVSFAQSSAMAALAIDLGLTAETAGTTMTKVFADMKSEAGKFAAFMGISTGEWISVLNEDGVTAFKLYLEKLNSLPAEVAAAAKVDLTGGGRIFEYITKMQNQLRQGDGSRMAILLREANREWIEGTSAIEEQQNVLSGTIAQWDIFKNKVNATFIAGGDQALSAINDTLKAVGDTLSSPEFVQGFADFISSFVAIGRLVTDTLSGLAGTASAVDWTTLFDIAGLLSVMALMKTIPLLFSGIGALMGGGGGMSGLFSLPKADAARPALFNAMAASLGGYVTKLRERQAVEAEAAATSAARAAQEKALATAQAQVQSRQIELAQQKAATTRFTAALEFKVEEARKAALTTRAALMQNVAALEERYASRIAALTASREQAQVRLNEAIASGSVAAQRAAQSQLTSIGRSTGGTNSYFSQAIARERAATERVMAGLVANYTAAIDRMRSYGATSRASTGFLTGEIEALRADRDRLAAEMGGIVTTTAAFKRSWAAAFMAAMPSGPLLSTTKEVGVLNAALASLNNTLRSVAVNAATAVRTLGFFGLLSAGLAASVRGLGTAVGFLSAGLRIASAIVSRFFVAWIVVDIVSMILDVLGLKQAVKDLTDEAIRWVNAATGLKIPQFADAEQTERATNAIREQAQIREKLYAGAEAFSKRFGKTPVSVSLDSTEFAYSLNSMEEALEKFYTNVRDTGKFGNAAGIIPGDAFVEGIRGVVAFETQLDALAEKLKEIQELQAADDKGQSDGNSELWTLERIGQTTGRNASQQERYNALLVQQEEHISRYLLRNMQARELEAQRSAVLKAQTETIKASVSILDESAGEDWFGGDQLLLRLRNQKQLVDSFSDTLARLRSEAGPGLQTGTISEEETDNLLVWSGRLAESQRTLEAMSRELASSRAAIKLWGNDSKAQIDKMISGGDIGALFAALSRDTDLAGAGIQRYMQGAGNVVDTVKEQNRLASQLLFGKEMARAYGLWANSARVGAEQAKNSVNQAVAQTRRDLEALVGYFLEVDAKIKGNEQALAAAPGNKKIDDATALKLFNLDLEKQKLEELIDIKEEEGRLSYSQAEKERFLLNKLYDEKEQRIKDGAELTKSLNTETQLKTNFAEQAAEARALQKEIEALTAKVNDPTLAQAQKDTYIGPLQEKSAALEATLGQLKGTLTSLSDIKPVGDQLVVDAADLAPLKDVLRTLTASAGAAKVDSLSSVQVQMESLVSSLDEGRQSAEGLVKTSIEGLARIAQEAGISSQVLATNIAAGFDDPAVQAAIEGLRERVSEGLVNVAGIRVDPAQASEGLKAFTDAWNAAVGNVQLVGPKIKMEEGLTEGAASLRGLLVQELAKPMSVYVDSVTVTEDMEPIDAPVSPVLDGDTLTKDIEKVMAKEYTLRPKVEPQGGGTSTGGTLPGFAGGGWIRGGGTSKSDSILARLAHGEYVMDALTVRMLGPGFFKYVQSIAKSGMNIRDLLPGFAGGGMVGAMPSFSHKTLSTSMPTLPAILAPVIQMVDSMKEEIGLNISFNGRPAAKVKGSREQVRGLTDALMELKRSM